MENPVAVRYAQAFFDHAQEENQVDGVKKDIDFLSSFLKSSSEFQYVINEPTIESGQRIHILKEAIKAHLKPLTFVFLLFLINKRRLNLLSNIVQEWEKIYLRANETIRVKVVSMFAVSDKQQKELIGKLSKKLKKEIQLNLFVDRNVLGGFKIQVGDTVYDYSFAYQLEKLKKQFLFT